MSVATNQHPPYDALCLSSLYLSPYDVGHVCKPSTFCPFPSWFEKCMQLLLRMITIIKQSKHKVHNILCIYASHTNEMLK